MYYLNNFHFHGENTPPQMYILNKKIINTIKKENSENLV